tara:strand:- start:483 stop:1295 length:813 start_codon:yes stop_codon:yes gene_type:complete
MWGITYGNDMFVACGSGPSGELFYSSDGINWSTSTDKFGGTFGDVGYYNGTFAASCGDTSKTGVVYSRDGVNWTQTTTGITNNNYRAITGGPKGFVAVNDTGLSPVVMWSATGGADSTALTFASGTDMSAVQSGDEAAGASGASGEVGDVDGTTINLVSSEGSWVNSETVAVTPDEAGEGRIISSDIANNKISVIESNDQFRVSQIVVGPNRICPEILSYAFDSADAAQFALLEDSLETYEEERDTRRAAFKADLISNGFTATQIASLNL